MGKHTELSVQHQQQQLHQQQLLTIDKNAIIAHNQVVVCLLFCTEYNYFSNYDFIFDVKNRVPLNTFFYSIYSFALELGTQILVSQVYQSKFRVLGNIQKSMNYGIWSLEKHIFSCNFFFLS